LPVDAQEQRQVQARQTGTMRAHPEEGAVQACVQSPAGMQAKLVSAHACAVALDSRVRPAQSSVGLALTDQIYICICIYVYTCIYI